MFKMVKCMYCELYVYVPTCICVCAYKISVSPVSPPPRSRMPSSPALTVMLVERVRIGGGRFSLCDFHNYLDIFHLISTSRCSPCMGLS